MLDLFVGVQEIGDAADAAGLPPLLPRDVRGCVAEAQRVVPRVPDFAAAHAAFDAAAGGGAALALLRRAEGLI